MNTAKERILAPHNFTQDETVVIAKRLAQTHQRLEALEDQKKSVTSDFKARIDKEAAEASLLSMKIAQGYEMRETDAVVAFFPKDGKKTYSRADNGEFIREDRMSPEDYQLEIKMASELPKEAPAPDPAAETATKHPDDTEIDETAREALISYSVKSDGFRNTLEGANLGTLDSVLNHLKAEKIGGQRRARVQEQIEKLKSANQDPKTTPEGFIWDADGLCQNPTSLTVTGPGMVKFAISAAKIAEDSDRPWRRGFSIKGIEPDADMLCAWYGFGFQTAREAYACALEDAITHFEKGKAHGVKEYAVTFRNVNTKAARDQILDAAVAAVESGMSETLDLASK